MPPDEAGALTVATPAAAVTRENSAPARASYEIRLPVFQGPLDLLLHLIEKRELDITTVSLVAVTEQYFEHLRGSETLNPDALADFIAIGAKLLLLKSASLLPQRTAAVEVEDEDPGQELTRLLQEYKRFKVASTYLQELDAAGYRSCPQLAPPKVTVAQRLEKIEAAALVRAWQRIREVRAEEPEDTIDLDPVSVADKIAELEGELLVKRQVSFNEIVRRCASRRAVAAAFLALLHLLRSGKVQALQEELFGEITIIRS